MPQDVSGHLALAPAAEPGPIGPLTNQDEDGAVLIVDDDKELRDCLADLLEDEGYDVATAANGAEALAYLERHQRPSLILLDLMMPVMNGWQFRDRQLESADLAEIPVIVMTAHASPPEVERAMPGVECVAKPLSVSRFLTCIERLAPHH
jgi:CheY-like chemotaxis protein